MRNVCVHMHIHASYICYAYAYVRVHVYAHPVSSHVGKSNLLCICFICTPGRATFAFMLSAGNQHQSIRKGFQCRAREPAPLWPPALESGYSKVRSRTARQAAAREVSRRRSLKHFSTTDTGNPNRVLSSRKAGGDRPFPRRPQPSSPSASLSPGPQSSLRRQLSIPLLAKPGKSLAGDAGPRSAPTRPSCWPAPPCHPLLSKEAKRAHEA